MRNITTYEIVVYSGIPPVSERWQDMAIGEGDNVREAASVALDKLIAKGWNPSWQLEADVATASQSMRGNVAIRVA